MGSSSEDSGEKRINKGGRRSKTSKTTIVECALDKCNKLMKRGRRSRSSHKKSGTNLKDDRSSSSSNSSSGFSVPDESTEDKEKSSDCPDGSTSGKTGNLDNSPKESTSGETSSHQRTDVSLSPFKRPVFSGEVIEVNWKISASLEMELSRLIRSENQVMNLALDFLDEAQPRMLVNVWRAIMVGVLKKLTFSDSSALNVSGTWRLKMKLSKFFDPSGSSERNISVVSTNVNGPHTSYARFRMSINVTEADGDDFKDWFYENIGGNHRWSSMSMDDLFRKFKIKYGYLKEEDSPTFILP